LPEHDEGGTYDPRSKRLRTFRRREQTYLVSVPGYEHRVHGVPNAGALLPWVSRVRSRLAVEPHYLGWWRDGRELVFDISIAIDGDRDFILDLAKSWGQKAVFHPSSKSTVYVPSRLGRVA
jgi:hypothetical protein